MYQSQYVRAFELFLSGEARGDPVLSGESIRKCVRRRGGCRGRRMRRKRRRRRKRTKPETGKKRRNRKSRTTRKRHK